MTCTNHHPRFCKVGYARTTCRSYTGRRLCQIWVGRCPSCYKIEHGGGLMIMPAHDKVQHPDGKQAIITYLDDGAIWGHGKAS